MMTEQGEASHPQPQPGSDRAPELLSEFRRAWREGKTATDYLSEHPELWQDKSFVLDIAYEEFCQRRESGDQADVSSFCARFAPFEKSLARLIDVHEFLTRHPAVLAKHHEGWPNVGDLFLGYELVEELGHGTFGRVYLAREAALGNREVVVKLSCGGLREASTLGRLQHTHIVPVLSVQEDSQGITALCMPYLGRTTLLDVLDVVSKEVHVPQSGVAITEAIERNGTANASAMRRIAGRSYVDGIAELAAQCAEALAYAHTQHICHFDLKPTNVLLGADGGAMLLDFNLAGDNEQAEMLIGGTLPYMSPEQLEALEGDPAADQVRLGPHSDVFALGVMLFQLLTGKHPFAAALQESQAHSSQSQLLEAHRGGPPPPLELNKDVEAHLAQLVERCLAVDPTNRPTAKELADQLRRYENLPRRLSRWVRRNKVLTSIIGSLAAVVVILALATWANRPPLLERQYAAALAAYEAGNFEDAIQHLDRGLEEEPDNVWLLLARARAYQCLETEETLNKAAIDYAKVAQQLEDPRIEAARGYCFSRLGFHAAALRHYEEAVQGNFKPAAVYNDMGYSLLRSGNLEGAAEHIQKALQVDGNFQAAHHNLAWIRFQESFQGKADLLNDVLPELQKAADLGPKSAGLYRDLARVHAFAAKQDTSHTTQAIEALSRAVALGLGRDELAKDGFLAGLKTHPRFADLLEQAATNRDSREPRLVDPLQAVDTREWLTAAAR